MQSNVEKETSLWVGLFVIVMSIVYVLVTMGKAEWVSVIAIIWGFFLAGLLFLEAGIIDYFARKDYKKISFGDVIVWLSVSFAVVIFVNSLLLIGVVKDMAPVWLSNFAGSIGAIAGIGGALLGLTHLLMPRFK